MNYLTYEFAKELNKDGFVESLAEIAERAFFYRTACSINSVGFSIPETFLGQLYDMHLGSLYPLKMFIGNEVCAINLSAEEVANLCGVIGEMLREAGACSGSLLEGQPALLGLSSGVSVDFDEVSQQALAVQRTFPAVRLDWASFLAKFQPLNLGFRYDAEVLKFLKENIAKIRRSDPYENVRLPDTAAAYMNNLRVQFNNGSVTHDGNFTLEGLLNDLRDLKRLAEDVLNLDEAALIEKTRAEILVKSPEFAAQFAKELEGITRENIVGAVVDDAGSITEKLLLPDGEFVSKIGSAISMIELEIAEREKKSGKKR